MNLDIPRMGYFIVYKGDKGLISKSIEQTQLSKGFLPWQAEYTHVEVSGGGSDAIRIGAPRIKNVDIVKRYKGRYVKILRYDNEDYEKKGRYKVAYFAATMCNRKYDWRGVLRFWFPFIGDNKGRYFCSEGSAQALQDEYPQAFNGAKPSTIMPAHFLNKEFVVVYEGVIE